VVEGTGPTVLFMPKPAADRIRLKIANGVLPLTASLFTH
jgi:hypothetical protein